MSPILFAQVAVETDQLLASWRITDPGTREGLIIFGAIGLVTLLVVLWAIYLRKRRRQRRLYHRSHEHSSEPAEENVPLPPQSHHKRRRPRRRRRSRNPTLAETGGLPPIRPESPPEPPS